MRINDQFAEKKINYFKPFPFFILNHKQKFGRNSQYTISYFETFQALLMAAYPFSLEQAKFSYNNSSLK